MSVLKKNPADPFRSGKEKHVVPESGRPIRDRETHAFARDHPAAANEQERRDAREPRETIEPLVIAVVSDRRTVPDQFSHGYG